MSTGSPARPRASSTIESGTPKPLSAAVVDRGGEDRGDHAPAPVDHRAAGVARAHQAAQRGDRCGAPGRGRRRPGCSRSRSGRGGRAARRRARSRGSRGSPPRCPPRLPRSAAARAAPLTPGTRSTARSLRESNQIASASRRSPSPPTCTVVSSWPATTWALVTTIPSPATQPLPCTPSPQAVPSTRTTLCGGLAHLRVAGDLRVRRRHVRPRARRSRGTGRSGRAPAGSGPTAAGAALSSLRIADCWIGSRSSRAPGVWSATAPPIQTRPSPSAPTSTAPPMPSSTPKRSPIRWRR